MAKQNSADEVRRPRVEAADRTSETPDAYPFAYEPGHPWHYLEEGDGAPPVPARDIQPSDGAGEILVRQLPRNADKRRAKLDELLAAERERLARDEAHYEDIVRRGAEALSRYDREIAYGENHGLARASSLALKFCHISNVRGRIAWIEEQLGRNRQLSLF